MPKLFDKCVDAGGRVRMLHPDSKTNLPVCFFPDKFFTKSRIAELKPQLMSQRKGRAPGSKPSRPSVARRQVKLKKGGQTKQFTLPKSVTGEARPRVNSRARMRKQAVRRRTAAD